MGPDWTTVAIGAGVPIAANIAFEVLLGELRRQVQRRRGLPAPVALPSLRLLRLLLAPRSTFQDWRDEVLARTATIPMLDPAAGPDRVAAPQPIETPATTPLGDPELLEGPVGVEPTPALTAPPACPPGLLAGPSRGLGASTVPDERPTRFDDRPAPTGIGDHSADEAEDLAETTTGTHDATDEGVDPADGGAGDEVGSAGACGASPDGDASGDGRVRLLGELLESGAPVTGAQAAMLLSHTHSATSGRTGRRLLAEARHTLASATSPRPDDSAAAEDQAATGTDDTCRPGAGVPLALVPRPPSSRPAGELP